MTRYIVILSCIVLIATTASYAAPPAPVSQTGQTTCWDSAGTVIACEGTGQDGDRRAGVAWPIPRFTDNSNGTITDNLTGLIWLQDAGCSTLGGTTWYVIINNVNALHSGQCGLSDNSVAGQWRVPNKNELESIRVNAQETQSGYWLNSQGFKNAQMGGSLASSSTHANLTAHAWTMGSDGIVLSYGNKGYNQHLGWAVR